MKRRFVESRLGRENITSAVIMRAGGDQRGRRFVLAVDPRGEGAALVPVASCAEAADGISDFADPALELQIECATTSASKPIPAMSKNRHGSLRSALMISAGTIERTGESAAISASASGSRGSFSSLANTFAVPSGKIASGRAGPDDAR